jgi:2,6-dihydroxypyridine 3-monooxygenase
VSSVSIIGGSIAGCLSALALGERGFEVTVIERSASSLTDRGAAVVIPQALFSTLKSLGYIDLDTPHLVHGSISFRAHRRGIDEDPLWSIPADVVALRWGHLYQQLRKRLDEDSYLGGVGVIGIGEADAGATLELDSGASLSSDLVIGADGIHSVAREHICGNLDPHYSGYVLWRGLLDEAAIATPGAFQGIYWAPYNGGLAGAYFIAGSGGETTPGRRTLNWGIYDRMSPDLAGQLVPGLSRGDPAAYNISGTGRRRLRDLAETVLPKALRQVALETERPFVQPIVDVLPPRLARGRTVLVGDACAVLRPHSASGISKAVQNVLALSDSLAQHDDLDRALGEWEVSQLESLGRLSRLTRSLGAGMVTDAPDWDRMEPRDMPGWWETMAAGEKWFMDEERAKGGPQQGETG